MAVGERLAFIEKEMCVSPHGRFSMTLRQWSDEADMALARG